MTTLTQVSKQLTIKSVETDEDFVTTTYTCDVRADIAGDSIWDCELTAADDVRITTIYVTEGVAGGDYDNYRSVNVCYTVNGFDDGEALDETWRLYTDSGFEATVSDLLGESVSFTEQGMQEDGVASME
jgi:hypothetical protein